MTKASFLLGLALVLCLCIQQSSSASFPQSLAKHMATRQMRYHHYLWHNVRESWNRFNNSTKNAFRKIGWEPPYPARNYNSAGEVSSIPDNLSGEDFLYMHRQMITSAKSLLSKNGESSSWVKGWTSIPAPGDDDYPVSGSYNIPSSSSETATVKKWKTNSFYYDSIKPAEASFKDPNQLRKMTLSELGARIEVTIHAWLHLRFSKPSSYGYRSGSSGTIPNMNKKWDSVNYNWLVDLYSSAVNPTFWKIHGWVDDRIEDWRRANGLSSIRWKGTWTGGPISSLGTVLKMEDMHDGEQENNPDSVGDVLEEAFSIFVNSGVPESSPADSVKSDFVPVKTRVCKTWLSKKRSK